MAAKKKRPIQDSEQQVPPLKKGGPSSAPNQGGGASFEQPPPPGSKGTWLLACGHSANIPRFSIVYFGHLVIVDLTRGIAGTRHSRTELRRHTTTHYRKMDSPTLYALEINNTTSPILESVSFQDARRIPATGIGTPQANDLLLEFQDDCVQGTKSNPNLNHTAAFINMKCPVYGYHGNEKDRCVTSNNCGSGLTACLEVYRDHGATIITPAGTRDEAKSQVVDALMAISTQTQVLYLLPSNRNPWCLRNINSKGACDRDLDANDYATATHSEVYKAFWALILALTSKICPVVGVLVMGADAADAVGSLSYTQATRAALEAAVVAKKNAAAAAAAQRKSGNKAKFFIVEEEEEEEEEGEQDAVVDEELPKIPFPHGCVLHRRVDSLVLPSLVKGKPHPPSQTPSLSDSKAINGFMIGLLEVIMVLLSHATKTPEADRPPLSEAYAKLKQDSWGQYLAIEQTLEQARVKSLDSTSFLARFGKPVDFSFQPKNLGLIRSRILDTVLFQDGLKLSPIYKEHLLNPPPKRALKPQVDSHQVLGISINGVDVHRQDFLVASAKYSEVDTLRDVSSFSMVWIYPKMKKRAGYVQLGELSNVFEGFERVSGGNHCRVVVLFRSQAAEFPASFEDTPLSSTGFLEVAGMMTTTVDGCSLTPLFRPQKSFTGFAPCQKQRDLARIFQLGLLGLFSYGTLLIRDVKTGATHRFTMLPEDFERFVKTSLGLSVTQDLQKVYQKAYKSNLDRLVRLTDPHAEVIAKETAANLLQLVGILAAKEGATCQFSLHENFGYAIKGNCDAFLVQVVNKHLCYTPSVQNLLVRATVKSNYGVGKLQVGDKKFSHHPSATVTSQNTMLRLGPESVFQAAAIAHRQSFGPLVIPTNGSITLEFDFTKMESSPSGHDVPCFHNPKIKVRLDPGFPINTSLGTNRGITPLTIKYLANGRVECTIGNGLRHFHSKMTVAQKAAQPPPTQPKIGDAAKLKSENFYAFLDGRDSMDDFAGSTPVVDTASVGVAGPAMKAIPVVGAATAADSGDGDGFDDEVVLEEPLEEKEDLEIDLDSNVGGDMGAVVQDAAVVENPIAGDHLGDVGGDDEMDVELEAGAGSGVSDVSLDAGVNAGIASLNREEINLDRCMDVMHQQAVKKEIPSISKTLSSMCLSLPDVAQRAMFVKVETQTTDMWNVCQADVAACLTLKRDILRLVSESNAATTSPGPVFAFLSSVSYRINFEADLEGLETKFACTDVNVRAAIVSLVVGNELGQFAKLMDRLAALRTVNCQDAIPLMVLVLSLTPGKGKVVGRAWFGREIQSFAVGQYEADGRGFVLYKPASLDELQRDAITAFLTVFLIVGLNPTNQDFKTMQKIVGDAVRVKKDGKKGRNDDLDPNKKSHRMLYRITPAKPIDPKFAAANVTKLVDHKKDKTSAHPFADRANLDIKLNLYHNFVEDVPPGRGGRSMNRDKRLKADSHLELTLKASTPDEFCLYQFLVNCPPVEDKYILDDAPYSRAIFVGHKLAVEPTAIDSALWKFLEVLGRCFSTTKSKRNGDDEEEEESGGKMGLSIATTKSMFTDDLDAIRKQEIRYFDAVLDPLSFHWNIKPRNLPRFPFTTLGGMKQFELRELENVKLLGRFDFGLSPSLCPDLDAAHCQKAAESVESGVKGFITRAVQDKKKSGDIADDLENSRRRWYHNGVFLPSSETRALRTVEFDILQDGHGVDVMFVGAKDFIHVKKSGRGKMFEVGTMEHSLRRKDDGRLVAEISAIRVRHHQGVFDFVLPKRHPIHLCHPTKDNPSLTYDFCAMSFGRKGLFRNASDAIPESYSDDVFVVRMPLEHRILSKYNLAKALKGVKSHWDEAAHGAKVVPVFDRGGMWARSKPELDAIAQAAYTSLPPTDDPKHAGAVAARKSARKEIEAIVWAVKFDKNLPNGRKRKILECLKVNRMLLKEGKQRFEYDPDKHHPEFETFRSADVWFDDHLMVEKHKHSFRSGDTGVRVQSAGMDLAGSASTVGEGFSGQVANSTKHAAKHQRAMDNQVNALLDVVALRETKEELLDERVAMLAKAVDDFKASMMELDGDDAGQQQLGLGMLQQQVVAAGSTAEDITRELALHNMGLEARLQSERDVTTNADGDKYRVLIQKDHDHITRESDHLLHERSNFFSRHHVFATPQFSNSGTVKRKVGGGKIGGGTSRAISMLKDAKMRDQTRSMMAKREANAKAACIPLFVTVAASHGLEMYGYHGNEKDRCVTSNNCGSGLTACLEVYRDHGATIITPAGTRDEAKSQVVDALMAISTQTQVLFLLPSNRNPWCIRNINTKGACDRDLDANDYATATHSQVYKAFWALTLALTSKICPVVGVLVMGADAADAVGSLSYTQATRAALEAAVVAKKNAAAAAAAQRKSGNKAKFFIVEEEEEEEGEQDAVVDEELPKIPFPHGCVLHRRVDSLVLPSLVKGKPHPPSQTPSLSDSKAINGFMIGLLEVIMVLLSHATKTPEADRPPLSEAYAKLKQDSWGQYLAIEQTLEQARVKSLDSTSFLARFGKPVDFSFQPKNLGLIRSRILDTVLFQDGLKLSPIYKEHLLNPPPKRALKPQVDSHQVLGISINGVDVHRQDFLVASAKYSEVDTLRDVSSFSMVWIYPKMKKRAGYVQLGELSNVFEGFERVSGGNHCRVVVLFRSQAAEFPASFEDTPLSSTGFLEVAGMMTTTVDGCSLTPLFRPQKSFTGFAPCQKQRDLARIFQLGLLGLFSYGTLLIRDVKTGATHRFTMLPEDFERFVKTSLGLSVTQDLQKVYQKAYKSNLDRLVRLTDPHAEVIAKETAANLLQLVGILAAKEGATCQFSLHENFGYAIKGNCDAFLVQVVNKHLCYTPSVQNLLVRATVKSNYGVGKLQVGDKKFSHHPSATVTSQNTMLRLGPESVFQAAAIAHRQSFGPLVIPTNGSITLEFDFTKMESSPSGHDVPCFHNPKIKVRLDPGFPINTSLGTNRGITPLTIKYLANGRVECTIGNGLRHFHSKMTVAQKAAQPPPTQPKIGDAAKLKSENFYAFLDGRDSMDDFAGSTPVVDTASVGVAGPAMKAIPVVGAATAADSGDGDGFDDEVVLEEPLEEKEDLEIDLDSNVGGDMGAVVQDAAVVENPIAGDHLGDVGGDDEMDVELEAGAGSGVSDVSLDAGVNAGIASLNREEINLDRCMDVMHQQAVKKEIPSISKTLSSMCLSLPDVAQRAMFVKVETQTTDMWNVCQADVAACLTLKRDILRLVSESNAATTSPGPVFAFLSSVSYRINFEADLEGLETKFACTDVNVRAAIVSLVVGNELGQFAKLMDRLAALRTVNCQDAIPLMVLVLSLTPGKGKVVGRAWFGREIQSFAVGQYEADGRGFVLYKPASLDELQRDAITAFLTVFLIVGLNPTNQDFKTMQKIVGDAVRVKKDGKKGRNDDLDPNKKSHRMLYRITPAKPIDPKFAAANVTKLVDHKKDKTSAHPFADRANLDIKLNLYHNFVEDVPPGRGGRSMNRDKRLKADSHLELTLKASTPDEFCLYQFLVNCPPVEDKYILDDAPYSRAIFVGHKLAVEPTAIDSALWKFLEVLGRCFSTTKSKRNGDDEEEEESGGKMGLSIATTKSMFTDDLDAIRKQEIRYFDAVLDPLSFHWNIKPRNLPRFPFTTLGGMKQFELRELENVKLLGRFDFGLSPSLCPDLDAAHCQKAAESVESGVKGFITRAVQDKKKSGDIADDLENSRRRWYHNGVFLPSSETRALRTVEFDILQDGHGVDVMFVGAKDFIHVKKSGRGKMFEVGTMEHSLRRKDDGRLVAEISAIRVRHHQGVFDFVLPKRHPIHLCHPTKDNPSLTYDFCAMSFGRKGLFRNASDAIPESYSDDVFVVRMPLEHRILSKYNLAKALKGVKSHWDEAAHGAKVVPVFDRGGMWARSKPELDAIAQAAYTSLPPTDDPKHAGAVAARKSARKEIEAIVWAVKFDKNLPNGRKRKILECLKVNRMLLKEGKQRFEYDPDKHHPEFETFRSADVWFDDHLMVEKHKHSFRSGDTGVRVQSAGMDLAGSASTVGEGFSGQVANSTKHAAKHQRAMDNQVNALLDVVALRETKEELLDERVAMLAKAVDDFKASMMELDGDDAGQQQLGLGMLQQQVVAAGSTAEDITRELALHNMGLEARLQSERDVTTNADGDKYRVLIQKDHDHITRESDHLLHERSNFFSRHHVFATPQFSNSGTVKRKVGGGKIGGGTSRAISMLKDAKMRDQTRSMMAKREANAKAAC
ncbi:hypothetical protein HDU98_004968, partial [Podochytrium sp. JEL0797]